VPCADLHAVPLNDPKGLCGRISYPVFNSSRTWRRKSVNLNKIGLMSLFQQCNDVMLMCYLSTITKGANSLNEVCLFYLHPLTLIKEQNIKV